MKRDDINDRLKEEFLFDGIGAEDDVILIDEKDHV